MIKPKELEPHPPAESKIHLPNINQQRREREHMQNPDSVEEISSRKTSSHIERKREHMQNPANNRDQLTDNVCTC